MVLAGGFNGMHGMGFGLGFLNLIGTILFFAFIFMAIKFFVKGRHYTHGHGDWGSWGPGSWKQGPPWMHGREGQGKERQGKEGFHLWQNDDSRPGSDEAIDVARERLAQSEISPEQFETIKQGLKVDMSDPSAERFDKAVHLARLRFAKGDISAEEFEAVKKTLLS
jgi:uncharacterized membrane protein